MLDYTKFQDVFPADLQIPYDRKLQHEIDDHRKSLDGTLFIDRVMKALGIAKCEYVDVGHGPMLTRDFSEDLPPKVRQRLATAPSANMRRRNVDAPQAVSALLHPARL